MNKIVEVAADSIASALAAAKGGAKRIELCENLPQGGVTPSYGKLIGVQEKSNLPINVLIRPRKGDFLYTPEELEVILKDVDICRQLGMNGIVFGALTRDGNIDLEMTQLVFDHAKDMDFTFHRAFDLCKNPLEAIDQLRNMGVKRILTSGQKPTAPQGAENIKSYIKAANGAISFMVGGGVRPESVAPLLAIEGIHEFHTSGATPVKSLMEFKGNTPLGAEDPEAEFTWNQTNEEVIRALVEKVGA
jgi:copper homeostasis protein